MAEGRAKHINKARGQVTADPKAAEAMVQYKTNDLTAETELRPEVLDRLMRLLRTAGQEIKQTRGRVYCPRTTAH